MYKAERTPSNELLGGGRTLGFVGNGQLTLHVSLHQLGGANGGGNGAAKLSLRQLPSTMRSEVVADVMRFRCDVLLQCDQHHENRRRAVRLSNGRARRLHQA